VNLRTNITKTEINSARRPTGFKGGNKKRENTDVLYSGAQNIVLVIQDLVAVTDNVRCW
jgi:hypothetical protein